MNDQHICGNQEVFVSFVYDEMNAEDRLAFDAHLAQCTSCSAEIRGLRGVRGDLASWNPPDEVLGFQVVRQTKPARAPWAWLQMPAWAQLAAAALVVGIATGISGLEVRYDNNGLVIRTGWQKSAAGPQSSSPVMQASAAGAAPWKTDLASLGQQLRQQFQSTPGASAPEVPVVTSVSGTPMSDAEFAKRVRALLAASNVVTERDLALRLAEVVRDVDAQRRADMVRVADGLGVIEGRTGAVVAQQRDIMNYLTRVSQRQEPPR
jgi:hypothetical protein